MFAVNRVGVVAARSVIQAQPSRTLVVTPPRIRVSFAEKVCHGLAIALGVTITPIWVIVHLDNYKNKT